MDNQQSEKESPDKRDSEITESAETKTEAIAGLVEVKQERGIKLEPDDVDTIEYTQAPNQLTEVFAPKIEKVEPDDNDDEVDGAWELFDRFGYLDSFNSGDKIGSNSMNQNRSKNNSSHMTNKSNEASKASKRPEEGEVGGSEILPVAGSSTNIAPLSLMTTRVTAGPCDAHEQRSTSNKSKKQHKCINCGYVTTFSTNFKQHMLKHTGEKPFPCESCTKRFTTKQNLQCHMKVHVKKDSLHCSKCWKTFETKIELVGHESACKQRRYECHLCKTFSTSNIAHLKMHMRKHSGVRPFQCGQCLMKFTQGNSLKAHMKTHTNVCPMKYRCSVCARNFVEQSAKDEHQMNCKRRRYDCYLCQSYITYDKRSLQNHIRMQHTGEWPFKCNLCMKCYGFKSNFHQHMKRVHKQ